MGYSECVISYNNDKFNSYINEVANNINMNIPDDEKIIFLESELPKLLGKGTNKLLYKELPELPSYGTIKYRVINFCNLYDIINYTKEQYNTPHNRLLAIKCLLSSSRDDLFFYI